VVHGVVCNIKRAHHYYSTITSGHLASVSPFIMSRVYCSTAAEPEEAPVAEPETIEGWSRALCGERHGSERAMQ